MSTSAQAYWTTRRARDKERKQLAAQTADRLWWYRVNQAAVASVLPGYPIPDPLRVLPLLIHDPKGYPKGTRLVCRHLAR